MKYFKFKRYKFSTAKKTISKLGYNFLIFLKSIAIYTHNLKKIYTKFDIKIFKPSRIIKYINLRIFSYTNLKKKIFSNYKFIFLYAPGSLIFTFLVYLIIPEFYKYDKSIVEKIICSGKVFECEIKGKVQYSMYPSPRIKIQDLIIHSLTEKKATILKAQKASIKLSIKNLLKKEKQQYKKVQINNFEINLNYRNLKKYKKIFKKNIDFLPINFSKGKIMLFDGNNYIASINSANFYLLSTPEFFESEIKGNFLSDNIFIRTERKGIDNPNTNIILKMSNLNLLAKMNFVNVKDDKEDIISGNFLLKRGKNRITGIVEYKNKEIIINKSNVKNVFLEGNLLGKIKFLPFFNFDLDLNLNSINASKLLSHFLNLDEEKQQKIFKISDKINGKLAFSSDKVITKSDLVESFESRIQFKNGNLLIDQLLVNLEKIGAADFFGEIRNDKKFSSFNFESNIFVDNQKKFSRKFKIYDKTIIAQNLFVSGNIDLENLNLSIYEISDGKKFSNEDINYIEKEFNKLMFEKGYESLFNFSVLKEFVQSVVNVD